MRKQAYDIGVAICVLSTKDNTLKKKIGISISIFFAFWKSISWELAFPSIV